MISSQDSCIPWFCEFGWVSSMCPHETILDWNALEHFSTPNTVKGCNGSPMFCTWIPGISCRCIHHSGPRVWESIDLAMPLHLHSWLMTLQLDPIGMHCLAHAVVAQSCIVCPTNLLLILMAHVKFTSSLARWNSNIPASTWWPAMWWRQSRCDTIDSFGSFTCPWGARQSFSHWCLLRHPHDILMVSGSMPLGCNSPGLAIGSTADWSRSRCSQSLVPSGQTSCGWNIFNIPSMTKWKST